VHHQYISHFQRNKSGIELDSLATYKELECNITGRTATMAGMFSLSDKDGNLWQIVGDSIPETFDRVEFSLNFGG